MKENTEKRWLCQNIKNFLNGRKTTYQYITGHVEHGIHKNFSGNIEEIRYMTLGMMQKNHLFIIEGFFN